MLQSNYGGIPAVVVGAALFGAALFGISIIPKDVPHQEGGPRLTITDASGGRLESFFAGIPPNAKIAKKIKDSPSKPTRCEQGGTALDRIGRVLNIRTTVHAQVSCCPNGNCTCLGCGQYAMSYTCGFYCEGGNYSYPDNDPMIPCMGTSPTDPANCNGGCGCGVTGCYNGDNCSC